LHYFGRGGRSPFRPTLKTFTLAISTAGEIAAAMDWSLPYTLGVLARWKMAAAYCKAVLAHEHRVALEGSTAEAIDSQAKDLAIKAAGTARGA
jgi:hypothetical protein